MAFDVQALIDAAHCAECLSPNQKQNVLLYLLNGILENGTGGGGLHNFLSLTHPDTVPGPPTRGALVVGNATPDWESLPIGAANRVLRSDGVDATWGQLVLTTDVTGILPIANGGTNSGAALNNNRIMVSSGGAIVEAAALTDGQLLIGSTGAAPVAAGLTAGTNVTIGTGAGSITVNAVMPGGFTGFANPTASVGLAAVNGVATTAMRSDAAPPLSQAIAPTWTGPHIFSPTAALAIQLNPFGAAAGNTSELRVLELAASGTNYTGFKAADAMAASEIYVLPDAAPSANRFLRAGAVAAGVSTLSWTQISLAADVTGILPVANGGTGTSTAFTQGSVIFAGAAGVYTQDNANFFFDNTNNRLGLATAVPLYTLHVFGPGSLQYGFAAGALILGADLNATTISVNTRKIGRVNMVSYDGGATNTFLFGGDFQAGGNDIYFGGVTAGSQYAATAIHFFTGATQTTTGGIEKFTVNASGAQLPPTGAAAGNTGELRFLELAAGGTNYAGFKAADAMAASEIYVLPNAAPAANRFLQAAAVAGGVSALSWAQVSLTADVTGILPVANGGSGTSTAFTQGSVIFAGAAGVFAQDNANFFWDDTNNRLGIGTASPLTKLSNTSVNVDDGVAATTSDALLWSINNTGPAAVINNSNASASANGLLVKTLVSAGTSTFILNLMSGSASRLYVAAGGNIGVGEINPLAKLHVINSAAATVATIIKAAAAQSANLTEWQDSSGAALVIVDEIGNVGIGTSPAGKLHIYSNVAADTTSYFENAQSGFGSFLTIKANSGYSSVNIISDSAPAGLQQFAFGTFGQSNEFRIQDVTNNKQIFTLMSGAPDLSFYIDAIGNLGLGTYLPTAVLHLKAGTTAANTAPLKFTSGPLNTSAVAGQHEYNGNHYLTNVGLLRFPVGGPLFDSFVDASVGGAETDIFSSTLLANTFNGNGDKVFAVYGGNFVTIGTESVQLKAKFAGTTIWDSTAIAIATGTTSWRVRVELIRVSSTIIRYTVSLNTTGASGFVYAVSGELTGLTLSGTNALALTGTSSGVGSGAGDIVGKMSCVEFKPAV